MDASKQQPDYSHTPRCKNCKSLNIRTDISTNKKSCIDCGCDDVKMIDFQEKTIEMLEKEREALLEQRKVGEQFFDPHDKKWI